MLLGDDIGLDDGILDGSILSCDIVPKLIGFADGW